MTLETTRWEWEPSTIYQSPREDLILTSQGRISDPPHFIGIKDTKDKVKLKLGSVAGPVIQANGRLIFEDDLRSGGLLYCVSQ